MEIILYSSLPLGVFISTVSSTFLPIKAAPIGDSLLTFPSRGSASTGPTTV